MPEWGLGPTELGSQNALGWGPFSGPSILRSSGATQRVLGTGLEEQGQCPLPCVRGATNLVSLIVQVLGSVWMRDGCLQVSRMVKKEGVPSFPEDGWWSYCLLWRPWLSSFPWLTLDHMSGVETKEVSSHLSELAFQCGS